MAKSEFDFYSVPGIAGDFVVPAIACDPYRGSLDVSSLSQRAVDELVDLIHDEVQAPITITNPAVQPSHRGGYFFNQIPDSAKIIYQNVDIAFELPEETTYFSLAMSGLTAVVENYMTSPTYLLESEEATDTIHVMKESGGTVYRTCLFNEDELPINPSIAIRQAVPVRAYRWLPGPLRKSPALGPLEPTFSPRPVPLVFAQNISITGLNPHANTLN